MFVDIYGNMTVNRRGSDSMLEFVQGYSRGNLSLGPSLISAFSSHL